MPSSLESHEVGIQVFGKRYILKKKKRSEGREAQRIQILRMSNLTMLSVSLITPTQPNQMQDRAQ